MFPTSLTALTPANVAFLERSLESLAHPDCVIRGPKREACRGAISAAIQGTMTPLDAAASLFDAHATCQLDHLRSSRDNVECVECYPLREVAPRFGDLLGIAARLLEQSSTAGLSITEMTLARTSHPLMALNSYLQGTASMRPFYDAYVHPPDSRTWRYLPLQLLVAAVLMSASSPVPVIELCSSDVTLQDLRDMLDADPPRSPLCIPCPAMSGCRESLALCEPFMVHGVSLDAYRMTLHDLTHIAIFGSRPPDRVRESVRLYDALAASEQAVGLPERRRPWFEGLLDHLLTGYEGIAGSVRYVEQQLAAAAHDIGADCAREMLATFRARLAD